MIVGSGSKHEAGSRRRVQRSIFSATNVLGKRRRHLCPGRCVCLGTEDATSRSPLAGTNRRCPRHQAGISSELRQKKSVFGCRSWSAEQSRKFIVYLSRRTRFYVGRRGKCGCLLAKNGPFRRKVVEGRERTNRLCSARRCSVQVER